MKHYIPMKVKKFSYIWPSDEYTNVYTQKYLLSDYYDPGTILGSWDRSINQTKIPIFIELNKYFCIFEGYEYYEKEKNTAM